MTVCLKNLIPFHEFELTGAAGRRIQDSTPYFLLRAKSQVQERRSLCLPDAFYYALGS